MQVVKTLSARVQVVKTLSAGVQVVETLSARVQVVTRFHQQGRVAPKELLWMDYTDHV